MEAKKEHLKENLMRDTLSSVHNDAYNEDEFNYHEAFNCMMTRRLQRRYKGVYRQYSMLDKVITWIMIFYLLLMLGFFSFETNNSKEEDTRTAILRLIVAFCVILLLVEVALVIKWMVYWAMISFGLMALATRTIDPVEWTRDDLSWDTTIARNLVVTFLIITEIMTVLVHLFTHKVYPYLVRQGKLSETNWWKIHRCTSQSNTLFYTSKARFLSDVRYRIQYCGGLDDQKRPHGYGIWTDTNVHGEHLAGQWEHGVPVGPFRSHEHGSGYSFVNLRIGFCTNRAEIKGTDNYFWPKHAPDGIRWGVASVECSVSGGFFRFLPIVTHLTSDEKEKAPQNAAECLPYLRTPVDYVVYSQVEEENKSHQINSSYTTKRSRHLYRENSCPIVEFPVIEEEKEALVLIHGYNCCLDYAINRLGQLLTLGDFPAFIHPFVFSWPSAGLFAAFDAVKTGAESEATGQHLQFFFKSLAQAGYKKINVITHSMGARVFFNSLQRGFFDEVFLKVTAVDAQSVITFGKARLSTVTFCNPDYPLERFTAYGGTYDQLRKFCKHISLYADNMDGALYYSEIMFKPKLCGPVLYSLGKRVHMVHRAPNALSTADVSLMGDQENMPQIDVDVAAVEVNQKGHFDGVAAYAYNNNRCRHHVRGSESTEEWEKKAKLKYLDIDVIDTTWMDSNVHSVRHNYFNINPTLVDDLRQLIVYKKRAKNRPGLMNTEGNSHIFLVAPAFIKNK